MSTTVVRKGYVLPDELHAYTTLMCKFHEEHECVISSNGISQISQCCASGWVPQSLPTMMESPELQTIASWILGVYQVWWVVSLPSSTTLIGAG
jgi:hypothetical protein